MQGAPSEPLGPVPSTTRDGLLGAQTASVLSLMPAVVPEGTPETIQSLRALLAQAQGAGQAEPAQRPADEGTSASDPRPEATSAVSRTGDDGTQPAEKAAPATPAPKQQQSDRASQGKGPVRFVTHRVRQGETLWEIAEKYGTDVDTIASANGIYDVDYLRPGQVLQVPRASGVVHTVKPGETLWAISRRYGVSMRAIQEANGLESPDLLRPGTRLVIPGATRARVEQVVVGGRLQRAFSWPVRGRISSGYGWRWGRMHEGIDIAVPVGTPVRAAASGRVVYAGWGGNYGYLVSIDHGNGVVTRYAHNSRLVVRTGQTVSRGQIVAYSGNTGNSTGPHLHFEIRHRGRAVDPRPFLR